MVSAEVQAPPSRRAGLPGLVRAELLKLFSTRTWWGILVPVFLLAGLAAFGTAEAPVQLTTSAAERTTLVLSAAGVNVLFAVVVAAIVITSEFRHGTATSSFLFSPDRLRVLAAKVVVSVAAVVGYAIVALCAAALSGFLTLGARGLPIVVTSSMWRLVGGAILASCLYGILALFVGATVRSQIWAIIGIEAYLVIVEPIVQGVSTALHHPGVPRFLLGTAAAAIEGSGRGFFGGEAHSASIPPFWEGLAIFVVYVAVFVVAGWAVLTRVDIPASGD